MTKVVTCVGVAAAHEICQSARFARVCSVCPVALPRWTGCASCVLLLDEVLRGRLDPTVYLYSHYIYTVVFLCPESCNSTLHVHVTRYTIHDTRYTIHDTRYTYTRHTLHDTQYTIHNTRHTYTRTPSRIYPPSSGTVSPILRMDHVLRMAVSVLGSTVLRICGRFQNGLIPGRMSGSRMVHSRTAGHSRDDSAP